MLLVVLVTAVMKWKKRDQEEIQMREKAEMARRMSQENIKRTKGRSRRGSTVSDNFRKTNGSRNRRDSNLAVPNQRRESRRESRTIVTAPSGEIVA